jgi:hypothetical protein
VLVASALVGAALWHVTGHASRNAVSTPLGFAALLAGAGAGIRLSGEIVWSGVVVGILILAAIVYLVVVRARTLPDPPAIVTAAGVTCLALIPFGVSRRFGLLGAGTNDDIGEHLLAAWTLQGHAPLHANRLIDSGYPIGPHAVAALISGATGMGLPQAFMGVIVAIPALLALAALDLLPERPRPLRVAAAALIGLCYLQTAYLVQASFKEPIESVLLVAFVAALTVADTEGGTGALRLVPPAVIAAASVYVNSYLGLVWPAGALGLWWVARFVCQRWVAQRDPGTAGDAAVSARLDTRPAGDPAAGTPPGRPWRHPVSVATLAGLVLVAPEIARMLQFAQSAYNHEGPNVLGDLLRPLSPLEALGIWPRLDFRYSLPLASFGGVVALMAIPALLAATLVFVRRREFALPAALLTAAALFAVVSDRSPYTAAKSLVIASPLVTLALARGLMLVLPSLRRAWGLLAAAVLATLLVVGAYSDVELLRDGPVGPTALADQLGQLRAAIGHERTLFLGNDDLIHWELRGADLATPPEPLYAMAVVPLRRAKAQPAPSNYTSPHARTTRSRFAGLGLAFDFDSVPTRWLDRFRYAILPRSGYGSPAPPNWHLVGTTDSYELWRRSGTTRGYQTLASIDNPGAVLDCTTGPGRALAARRGVAMVQPAPVVGERTAWKGQVGYAGRAAHQILHLDRGTWTISLQYAGAVSVSVRAPGLEATLPANLGPLGTYWYVGRVDVRRRGDVRIVVRYGPLTVLGRLLGAFGLTRAPAPTGLRPLGRVTAARPGRQDRLIPLRQACGRYVDWYRLTS